METVQIECRCKDCEFYKPCSNFSMLHEKFYTFGLCKYLECSVNEDNFCSYGDRKEK